MPREGFCSCLGHPCRCSGLTPDSALRKHFCWGSGGPSVVLEMRPGLAMMVCKARSFPAVLALGPCRKEGIAAHSSALSSSGWTWGSLKVTLYPGGSWVDVAMFVSLFLPENSGVTFLSQLPMWAQDPRVPSCDSACPSTISLPAAGLVWAEGSARLGDSALGLVLLSVSPSATAAGDRGDWGRGDVLLSFCSAKCTTSDTPPILGCPPPGKVLSSSGRGRSSWVCSKLSLPQGCPITGRDAPGALGQRLVMGHCPPTTLLPAVSGKELERAGN